MITNKTVSIVTFGLSCIILGCAPKSQPVEFSTSVPVSANIPDELKTRSEKRVAVVGMENKSIFRADKLWDIASDLLTTRLVEIGYFRTTDWQRMKARFDSGSLRTSSLVNTPERLVNVKNQLSVDHFLGGAVTFYDVSQTGKVSAISKRKTITTTVRVDLWLQDALSGEYLSAASGNGKAKQQFSGGMLSGTVGTWDVNVANKSLTLAIDDALVKLLKTYQERQRFRASSEDVYSVRLPESPDRPSGSSSYPAQPSGSSSLPYPPPISPTQKTDSGSVPLTNPKQFRRKSNKWAIVVGVGQFADPMINPLRYTDDDALAMYQYLTDPKYGGFVKDQVFLMVNNNATTLRIKNAIDIISIHAKPEDMVVIFISTHGTPGSRDYDVEGIGYLISYDTLPHSLYATAYSMSELVRAIRDRIKAETVVTLMDACYSATALKGTLYKKRGTKDLVIETHSGDIPKKMVENRLETDRMGISDATVREISNGTGKLFITSSQSDEKSWESETLEHGFFTYYLLQALKRKGGDISVQEAYRYLKEEMPKAVMREKQHPQHPIMGMGDVRKDIFITAKSISAE